MRTTIDQSRANDAISRLVGVKATDSPIEAAEKALALMKAAGLPTRKAQAMIDAAKKRGVK